MKTTLQKLFAVSFLTFLFSVFVLLSTAQTTETFITPGSFSWVCPYGVTSITVETWGGGGGGGAAPSNPGVGGGGGGGAYRITTLVPVTFGTPYNYVVGAGGLGNVSTAGANGIASSFNGLYIANPGLGGGISTTLATGGAGGTGGTFNGGNGAAGIFSPAQSGGGGGGAGSGGDGGTTLTNAAGTGGATDGGAGGAGVTSNIDGGNASIIGGGGGGALRNGGGGAKKGGNGARGQVRITYTINCTAPPAQPTSLVLTPGSSNIGGSFTGAANTSGYIIIRTTTSAAPSNPVNGTTYTSGTSALGGFIESVGTGTTFNSTSLVGGTQYWYWVYGYNNVSCVGGIRYLNTSPLTATATTIVCGAVTNSVTITSLAGASYNSGTNTWVLNWSSLSWSLGLPTACQNIELIVNRSAATSAENININLDQNVSIKNLLMRNISNTPFRIVFQIASPTSGAFDLLIDGNCTIECPGVTGTNRFNRCSILNNGRVTIMGDLVLGRIPSLTAPTEGHSSIGSGNASTGTYPNQILTFFGNMTFNPRGFTVDEHTVFIFNKPGTQYIYNYTRPLVADTSYPILFEDLRIGTTNATTLIMAGTMFDGYIEHLGRAGITIGVNSTLDLPANFSLNVWRGGLPTGSTILPSYLRMFAGSRLRLGGNASVPDVFGFTHGVAGSNFPGFISPYTLDPTSTIEYYGSNAITQTIFNEPTYANLLVSNGSGSGRATKQTIAGTLRVNSSFNINAITDVYLGTATGLGTSTAPVTSNSPLNINATGGLYCNANVVSGTGSFTMGNGSFLGMGHVQGISNLGSATGNIQMTGARTYNTTGNYIYNGIATQITGAGLPTTVNDLTTDNPFTVTIATNQIVNGVDSLRQGTFDIGSTRITHNGTGRLNSVSGKMKANLGIVEMKGNSGIAQNLSGNWFLNKTISSLVNANTTGITVAPAPADTLLIASALVYEAVSNSVINTNDNVTLLSRDTATARFGTMVSGNSITGKVTIERFLPAKKSWRFLAAPVVNTTAPTVTNSWRESGAPLTSNGYGTRITGPASFVGVDELTQRASMKFYNGNTNNYVDVSNTNTTNISNTAGYYIFVRGDRGVPITGAAGSTILRIKGDVITGNQTVPIPSGKFVSFGNPYASKLNFKTLGQTNMSSSFIVWNPNSLGDYNVGAFETYALLSGEYRKVPGGTIKNTIESGEAVFIQSNAGIGSLTIAETDKVDGVSTPVSRNGEEGRVGVTAPTLEINLHTKNIDGSQYLADGIVLNFGENYNSGVDNQDVRKILNTGDNLYLKNGNANLIVERRPLLNERDTIRLTLANTRVNPYHFEIDPSALHGITLSPMLKDKFLGTETPISLTNVTNYNFDITADAASRVADRFMIVFKQAIPMRFSKIAAVRNADKTATVTWYTENENNINEYKIEHSTDGINFTEIGRQMPTANNNGNPYYSFIHSIPRESINYYRVNAIAIRGAAQNSNTASINALEKTGMPALSVYPNPVVDGIVNVRFSNQMRGNYQLNIFNEMGQLIVAHKASVQTNNELKTIALPAAAAGKYQLKIMDENGKATTISFFVN